MCRDRCESCGKKYINHLGLIGTCKQRLDLIDFGSRMSDAIKNFNNTREDVDLLGHLEKLGEMLDASECWQHYLQQIKESEIND